MTKRVRFFIKSWIIRSSWFSFSSQMNSSACVTSLNNYHFAKLISRSLFSTGRETIPHCTDSRPLNFFSSGILPAHPPRNVNSYSIQASTPTISNTTSPLSIYNCIPLSPHSLSVSCEFTSSSFSACFFSVLAHVASSLFRACNTLPPYAYASRASTNHLRYSHLPHTSVPPSIHQFWDSCLGWLRTTSPLPFLLILQLSFIIFTRRPFSFSLRSFEGWPSLRLAGKKRLIDLITALHFSSQAPSLQLWCVVILMLLLSISLITIVIGLDIDIDVNIYHPITLRMKSISYLTPSFFDMAISCWYPVRFLRMTTIHSLSLTWISILIL